MPARIVMVAEDEFVVAMDVNHAASDILKSVDTVVNFEVGEGDETRRVYVRPEHIAYAEAYPQAEHKEPMEALT